MLGCMSISIIMLCVVFWLFGFFPQVDAVLFFYLPDDGLYNIDIFAWGGQVGEYICIYKVHAQGS